MPFWESRFWIGIHHREKLERLKAERKLATDPHGHTRTVKLKAQRGKLKGRHAGKLERKQKERRGGHRAEVAWQNVPTLRSNG